MITVIELEQHKKVIQQQDTLHCTTIFTMGYFTVDLADMFLMSRDYNELLWAWKNWRDQTGRQYRSEYVRFVQLGNEAARLNGIAVCDYGVQLYGIV